MGDDLITIDDIADGTGEMFHATCMFRWRRSPETTTASCVLEQMWQGGNGTQMWKPVPLEIVDEDA